MRYYRIDITNPTTGAVITPSSLAGGVITSLNADGTTNTQALNVEFDVPVAAFHAPDGNAFVRIWGLGIADVGGAFDLNPTSSSPGALVTVSAGMAAGLPLANPAQAGVLVYGQVIQAFGNWVGVNQTVDLILTTPSSGSSVTPVNYTLNWRKGMTLASALATCLSTALPNAKQVINISDGLTANYDQPGYYGSLTQLNAFLNPISRSIVTSPGYQGVSIFYDGSRVTASDGTKPAGANVTLAFQDLLGQPTWISSNTIQVKCVMRADVALGDMVTLPPSLATSSSSAFQGLTGNASNLTFSGPYLVTSIHHYGNFRQADAMSWNTTIEMVKPPS